MSKIDLCNNICCCDIIIWTFTTQANSDHIPSILTYHLYAIPKKYFCLFCIILMEKWWNHQCILVIKSKFMYKCMVIIHLHYIIECVWMYAIFQDIDIISICGHECKIYLHIFVGGVSQSEITQIMTSMKLQTTPPLVPLFMCHCFLPCWHIHPPSPPVMSPP